MTAAVRIKVVDSPTDPDLKALAALMDVVFADPNAVLGLDRMQEFLATNRPGGARRFCVLVATDPVRNGAVVGGTVFSHIARSNCGFSEYLVVDRAVRGRGLGRQLFDARKALLDAAAREVGYDGCRGLFIEVDSPERTPADLLAAERETALDAWARLRLFGRLGFRRVEVAYIQPALACDKQPVDYLDLLFAAWAGADAGGRIPSESVFDTLAAVWSAWSPETVVRHLADIKQRVRTADVLLRPVD
ncbi:MAG: GNAT family N-acetyltransferase [Chloroflexi bacterium]|nr:GNAT family N-acetyltransferase [Chloroflexota bacterium]